MAGQAERWLPVVGYEGRYEVSDLGRVRSTPRRRTRGGLLTPALREGYPFVVLYLNGTRHAHSVHHLVLEAFVGPRPEGQVARHGSPDRQDNRLANLCWGTYKENEADKLRDGTAFRLPRGTAHWRSELTEEIVRAMRQRYAAGGVLQRELAEEYGVTPGAVHDVIRGRRWSWVEQPPITPTRAQALRGDLMARLRGTDWCMPRLPAGLAGACLLVLGIEDVPMNAADILLWLEREGDAPFTRLQIHGALYSLGSKKRGHEPLAEIAEKFPGRAGTAFWRPTALGREIMAEDLDRPAVCVADAC